jgi:hypothetical protein
MRGGRRRRRDILRKEEREGREGGREEGEGKREEGVLSVGMDVTRRREGRREGERREEGR